MIALLAIATAAFAGVLVLGRFARLAPVGIDARVAIAAFGKATGVAWTFTNLGYARDLFFIYLIAAAALRIERPRDVTPLAFLAIGQVFSQLVSTGLKGIFKRERPEHWLKRHETSAGYPSGHATTATVTYGGVALGMILPIDPTVAPVIRDSLAAVAIVAALGIAWSRLALGAHYLSDVVGGVLLGCATLALLVTLLHRF